MKHETTNSHDNSQHAQAGNVNSTPASNKKNEPKEKHSEKQKTMRRQVSRSVAGRNR